MNDPTKPPGIPEDFGAMTEQERELRRIKAEQGGNPDVAFQEEMRQVEAQKKRAAEARAQYEREQKEAAGGPPAVRLMHLLISKEKGKFRVVGMYSTREKIALAIGECVGDYSAAGAVIGNVDLDLSIKVDAPALPPL